MEMRTLMRMNNTPGAMPGQPNLLAKPPQESPGLSLPGLLDLLTALAPQIQELPSPIPLFLREVEAGLAEQLGYEDPDEKTTDDHAWRPGVGGSAAGPTPSKGVDPCS